MKRSRLRPAARKEDILATAVRLAEMNGYAHLTRAEIAAAADITATAITYHFGTMTQLRREIMRYAVAHENLRVIAQGIAAGDTHAARADASLRSRALDFLR